MSRRLALLATVCGHQEHVALSLKIDSYVKCDLQTTTSQAVSTTCRVEGTTQDGKVFPALFAQSAIDTFRFLPHFMVMTDQVQCKLKSGEAKIEEKRRFMARGKGK
jgi:hypothetical protein